MKCKSNHWLARNTALKIHIPDFKVLSKSKQPYIQMNRFGFPFTTGKMLTLEIVVTKNGTMCSTCEARLNSPFVFFASHLYKMFANITFWGILILRQLTFNTRLGLALSFSRSLFSFVFLSFILIFAGASSVQRPIWLILNSFALWVCFEVGVTRCALVLNVFSELRARTRSSSFAVISASYITTMLDFVILSGLAFTYSFFISNLRINDWIFSVCILWAAYLLLIIPGLVFSYYSARANRDYRDAKHVLPWLVRILLFTVPIFDITYVQQFRFLKEIFYFSPLSLPFSLLHIPLEGLDFLNQQIFLGYFVSFLALLTLIHQRGRV